MSVITIPKPLRDKLGEDATEAFIQVVKELDESRKEDLATKGDITDMRRELAEVKAEIIKWVAAMLVAQAAAIAALVKLL